MHELREAMRGPIVVKKYSNRRLYATDESRYITLEELAEKIRGGRDVKVIDVATNDDLTQVTLTQVILESRGAGRLLPVPFLVQLIRMGDDALAEFFGRYLSAALELYLAAREGTRGVIGLSPFARIPLSPSNVIARLFSGLHAPAPRRESRYAGNDAPRQGAPPGWERVWEQELEEGMQAPTPEPPPDLPPFREITDADFEEPPTPQEAMSALDSLERQLAVLRRSISGKAKPAKKTKTSR